MLDKLRIFGRRSKDLLGVDISFSGEDREAKFRWWQLQAR